MSNKKNGGLKFLAGLGLGAGLGILFAPKSGKATRNDLKNKLEEFITYVKNIDVAEVKEEFLLKIDEIKEELDDLDKEKVMKIAEEKAEALKNKVNELVELAKEKGTPVIEDAADELRARAAKVTREVLKKLEKKENTK